MTPDISGQIHFRDAGFVIRRFNSFYQARDETIRFTPDGIVLDDFTLVDSAGNEAIVSGMVFTEDFKDFRFDLDAEADDFQVLNSTRDNNKLYFGRLFIDMDLQIKGGLNTPLVDGGNVRFSIVVYVYILSRIVLFLQRNSPLRKCL